MEGEVVYETVLGGNLLYTITFTLVFLLLMITNVLLLIVFIRNPVLITPPQLFHINVACSNITLALFSLTFALVTLISGEWIFPHIVCHLVGFFNSCFLHILLLTAFASLNSHYQSRLSARRHSKLYTTRGVGFRIGAFWGISISLSVLPFIPDLGSYSFSRNLGTCSNPTSLLGMLPVITNSIYIVLWAFVTFNLATLPKVSLPASLKSKQTRPSSSSATLAHVVTSGIYTVAAVLVVLTYALQKAGSIGEVHMRTLERASLLIAYSSMILMPVSVVAFSPELRVCLREVCRRCDSGGQSKYEQIDQAPRDTSKSSPGTCSTSMSGVHYPGDLSQTLPPGHSYPRVYRPYPGPYSHPQYQPTLHTAKGPYQPRNGVHRSHSLAGSVRHVMYQPRQYAPVTAARVHVQRSQSLGRLAAGQQEQHNIEMKIMRDQCVKVTEKIPSSVHSSSTVGDIVDL